MISTILGLATTAMFSGLAYIITVHAVGKYEAAHAPPPKRTVKPLVRSRRRGPR